MLFTSDVGSVVHKCLTIDALLALLRTCRAAKAAIAFTSLAEAVLVARDAGGMIQAISRNHLASKGSAPLVNRETIVSCRRRQGIIRCLTGRRKAVVSCRLWQS